MGSMSFLLPNSLAHATSGATAEACIASTVGYFDHTPVPTQLQFVNGCLTAGRTQNESGCLVTPWNIERFGTLAVSTTTLRERPEPYRLLVELARGKLNQVRSQAAEWQGIGLRMAPTFNQTLAETTRLFGRAALADSQAEADTIAASVIERTHEMADRLVRDYVEQMFATRHEEEGQLDTRLSARHIKALSGCAADEYTRSFNATNVCFRWCDVEPHEAQCNWEQADAAVIAASDTGLPVTIGPVIDLAPGMLPAWTAGWESDLPALAAFMCDYLETAISRYKKEARRWIICAGFNHTDSLGLVDDDRLRLAFRLFEAAAQVDPGIELILSVAQPWGDYLASDNQTISPLTFPDDLVRAGVRLAAVELEIRPGVRPRGSLPRDLLDTARLLDTFGMLGPPLEVVLSLPASGGTDPNATEHGQAIWAPGWNGSPSEQVQAEWGSSLAALALCWPKVRSVTWDPWLDADPHLVPHGGLLDASGHPRPLLERLRALRNEHLATSR